MVIYAINDDGFDDCCYTSLRSSSLMSFNQFDVIISSFLYWMAKRAVWQWGLGNPRLSNPLR